MEAALADDHGAGRPGARGDLPRTAGAPPGPALCASGRGVHAEPAADAESGGREHHQRPPDPSGTIAGLFLGTDSWRRWVGVGDWCVCLLEKVGWGGELVCMFVGEDGVGG